ncbi:SidA/IucD/PvdA family monooxygenase [Maricurvus nonylphenolicus]|uniref:lysine N(6)-hydroxylase/L-ornithine N(5)-oxygenase family protein n=1 Tax=Maricurvus nonylphenolicus TaxID=1008307 RepID=UPI0036F2D358
MTSENAKTLDVIGVGLGPFNLSLAALLHPLTDIEAMFFESRDQFDWHPGLMMEDCTLQVPMMADLTTMADPTSEFTYLNYLHRTGRLYNFYFYEEFLIPRSDYNRYCQWSAEQMHSLRFSHTVTAIKANGEGYQVVVRDNTSQLETIYQARHVVLGTGSVPAIPEGIQHLKGNANCIHSAAYLQRRAELQASNSITVIGAGQSAAEIVLDLLDEQPQHGYEINWLTRGDGFLPMEYSKLGLEHFSPDYIDYFHQLPEATRDSIRKGQDLWYKGISDFTIGEIYNRIYRRSIGNKPVPITLQARSELLNAMAEGDGLRLAFEHRDQQQAFEVTTDKLVLATGHRHPIPDCLSSMLDYFEKDSQQRLVINRDYTVASKVPLAGNLYVQNGELHSHGIGAPDLGLGAYRSAAIANQLIGRDHYVIRNKNVFQNFGVAEKWQGSSSRDESKAPELLSA